MNDLYFTAKKQKRLTKKSLSQKVYIISHEVAGYHQTAGKCTLARDEIQGRLAALDDIRHASRGDIRSEATE